jgi:hypothetical protein
MATRVGSTLGVVVRVIGEATTQVPCKVNFYSTPTRTCTAWGRRPCGQNTGRVRGAGYGNLWVRAQQMGVSFLL